MKQALYVPIENGTGGVAVAPPPPQQNDLLQLDDILWLLSFLRRQKWWLALGLVIGIGLSALYIFRSPQVFESKSQLLVSRKDPLNVPGMPSVITRSPDVLTTHVTLITSPWLAKRVLSDERIARMTTFSQSKKPSYLLSGSLAVTPINSSKRYDVIADSNILEFAFRGSYPDECADIVAAVIEAYRSYLDDANRMANQHAFELVKDEAEDISRALAKKQSAYEDFRRTAPNLAASDQQLSLSQQRLNAIESNLLTLQTRRTEIESRLRAWRSVALTDPNPIGVRAMLPETLKPRRETLNSILMPLLAEERQNERAGLGPNHPRMRSLQDRIEIARQMFVAFDEVVAPGDVSPEERDALLQQKATDRVAEHTFVLEQELEGILAAEKAMQARLQEAVLAVEREQQQENAAMRLRAEFDSQDQQWKQRIARDQQLFDALTSQLQRVDLDISAGDYSTTVIAPPTRARQVEPRPMLIATAGAFLGLIGGLILAVSVEISNRLSYVTQEAAQSLDVPVLGHIPTVASKTALIGGDYGSRALNPSLCTILEPDSPAAEAYRGLRTAIYFRSTQEPLKVIAVTSPNVGDGTSTLTANLAVSIAQSGRSVLLVDAHLHQPQVHRILDVSGEDGLSTLLVGDCQLSNVIQASVVPGLAVLTSGPRVSRPADLFSTPRFKELLSALEQQFDYVLLDTPAILAVSDAQILAANADGVLLNVRCGQNDGPSVALAEALLHQSGANVLGVALNRASAMTRTELTPIRYSANGVAGSKKAIGV